MVSIIEMADLTPSHVERRHAKARWRTFPKPFAAAALIASYFLAFTWRGLFLYFSGDDLMNLYGYWLRPLTGLIKANLFFWLPYYRPWGGVVYRTLFAIFGFNPRPLYLLYYAVLLFNLWLAYCVMKRLSSSTEIATLGTLLFSVHGTFTYLYFNAGCLYDVFCFLFFFTALLIYLRVRQQGSYPGWRQLSIFLLAFICCLNSKEMGVALPVIVLLYELMFHPPRSLRPAAAWRWLLHEGRAALAASTLLFAYVPGKLGGDLATFSGYVPSFTWGRFLENMERYAAYLISLVSGKVLCLV